MKEAFEMKRFLIGMVSVAVLATVATGCASTGVSTSADSTKAATTAAVTGKAKSTAEPAPTPSHAAGIGDTITIKGNGSGAKIAVTLVKVAATTTSTDGFMTPAEGMRYYAAQFKIFNSGTAAYSDFPSGGAKAIDTLGQQYDTAYVPNVAAGPQFPSSLKIAVGGTALGYLVFEVPVAGKINGLQFSTSFGFGGTAQWAI